VASRNTNQLAANTLVSNLQFAEIDNSNALTWYEAGSILYTTANGQRSTLLGGQSLQVENYRIFSNGRDVAIIYPDFDEETAVLVVKKRTSGQWGEARVISQTGGFAKSLDGVLEKNGDISLIFNNSNMTIIGEGDNVQLHETNDLSALRVSVGITAN
jgi:hypothetical protein